MNASIQPLRGKLPCIDLEEGVPYDFSFFPSTAIGRSMAAGLAVVSGGLKAITVQRKVSAVRRFLEWLSDQEGINSAVGFEAILPSHLSHFEAFLREAMSGPSAASLMSLVNQVVRAIKEHAIRPVSPELAEAAEALDGSWGRPTPIEPYSRRELHQIRRACIQELRAALRAQREGDRIVNDRQHSLWEVVTYHRRFGPVTRREYEGPPPQGVRWSSVLEASFLLQPAAFALGSLVTVATGIEPSYLRELSSAQIQDLGGGVARLQYEKSRAHSIQQDEFRSLGTTGLLGLKRHALRLTQHLRPFASPDLRDHLILAVFHSSTLAGQVGRIPASEKPDRGGARRTLQVKYGLTTDDGDPLYIELSRLRKNFWAGSYEGQPYSLRKAVRGRKTLDVGQEHYFRVEALRPVHEQAVKAGLTRALNVVPSGPVDSELDEGFVSYCKDPLSSPYSPPGELCSDPILGCFFCDNAVFPEEKLPPILHLADEARQQRTLMSSDEWLRKWGAVWSQIFDHVLPRFTDEQRERAHALASDGRSDLFLPYELLNVKAR